MKRLSGGEEAGETGDGGDDYQPELPASVFRVSKKKKQTVHYILEWADDIIHTCDFGIELLDKNRRPFLTKDSPCAYEGKKGFCVELVMYIKGVVDQNPTGRWVHFARKRFSIDFPPHFHPVLGRKMIIDGHFVIVGEKPSRMKKTKVGFIEEKKNTMFENVPPNTKVIVHWKEDLIPAPYEGLWWCGVEVVLGSWVGED